MLMASSSATKVVVKRNDVSFTMLLACNAHENTYKEVTFLQP
jgi:hypothetical protein